MERTAALWSRRGSLPAAPETIFANIISVMRDFAPYHNARIPILEDYSLDPTGERYSLFQVSDWVMQSLTEPSDLTRITYEAFDIHDVPPRMPELGYAGAVASYMEGIQRAERTSA